MAHEPVKKAMSRIRELSADEEARRLAFVRERALRDEVSLLSDAKSEGRQEAEQRALAEKRETVRHLLAFGVLSDEQIAEATGLAVDEIANLRIEDKR